VVHVPIHRIHPFHSPPAHSAARIVGTVVAGLTLSGRLTLTMACVLGRQAKPISRVMLGCQPEDDNLAVISHCLRRSDILSMGRPGGVPGRDGWVEGPPVEKGMM
jgi:hypothetical protein